LIQFKKKEARFRDASENALPLEIAENPAQAEAEDSSKIKDRLEALLFAETLQGTLSPNANPGKGSIGGLLNLMPEATGRMHRSAETLVHLSSTGLLYQSELDCARGGIKKVMRSHLDRCKAPTPRATVEASFQIRPYARETYQRQASFERLGHKKQEHPSPE
jgi:hypothetical protein